MRRLLALVSLICICSSPLPTLAAIVVSADDTYAQVQVGMSPTFSWIPNSGTGANAFVSLSLIDESQTKTQFASTFLHGSFYQSRGGLLGGHSLGWYGVTFSVSVNSLYSALGNW